MFLNILQFSQENTCVGAYVKAFSPYILCIYIVLVYLVYIYIHNKYKACNFITKRLQHRCFPMNTAKLLGSPIFTKHLRWMLLIRGWIINIKTQPLPLTYGNVRANVSAFPRFKVFQSLTNKTFLIKFY